jgi:putative transposase
MLNQDEFKAWCQQLNLEEEAKKLIAEIRSSPPARRVQGGRQNVCGRYPSRKMGLTIQFESHKNELAAITEFEYDEDILEYYDQPFPPIRLKYSAINGKRLNILHTPDFFVIRKRSAGWVECKTERDLIRLAESQPNRYHQGQDGVWYCLPGEQYAQQLGLIYEIRSDSKNNRVYLRNIEFLEDYLRVSNPNVTGELREHLLSIVKSEPGISLERLLSFEPGIRTDDIYELIAMRDLFVDLSAAPLLELTKVAIYPNERGASSLTKFESSAQNQSQSILPSALPQKAAQDFMVTADLDDLEEANDRYRIVMSYLRGEGIGFQKIARRTLFRWLAQYRRAEQIFGNGYIGLLPKHRLRGNRAAKISKAAQDLMTQFIEQEYETLKQKPMLEVYGALIGKCESFGLAPPSYATFATAIKKRSAHQLTLKRQGPRAAYQKEEFYYQLDISTPRHGDRPFHICHLDHTELDIELVCSSTGQSLGRPWASFMTDAYSRRILALFLTYDPPSYRSCMMIIRECVRRHSKFPQVLVVDGGREFESIYFETLLAKYECTKKSRPEASPRFGSVIERLFGTTNTRFIYNLAGNTQITKNIRQVTKSVNPKSQAVWTLATFYERLCEWAYEIYDTLEHPTLGLTPRQSFNRALEQSGYRNHRYINYDNEFLMWTLPTTPKGRAKIHPGKGVKINHIYYWSNAFRDSCIERDKVPVRYDPFDIGTAYAYINNRWVTCHSEHYSSLHGRSERELMLLTSELRKRRKNHSLQFKVTAKKLADFIASVESEEAVLSQRLRDREAETVFKQVGKADRIQQSVVEEKTTRRGSEFEQKDSDELEIYEEF